MKQDIESKILCKDLPNEFVKYFEYIRKLQFRSHPDYNYIKNLFKKVGKA